MKTFSYRMLSASELELNITGTIGEGWDENPVVAKEVRRVLTENKNAKRIVVNIDSSGGSFFDGLAIYQMLQEHPATVDVVIGARSASAATMPQMAGDTIAMHETSTMLVHPVWTVAIGNAEELRKVADDLDMLSESSVKAYVARTGMDPDEVRALMSEDRYMSAEEALKLGFCTEIRKAKKKPSAMSKQDIQSEIEAMRTKATASASALRMAAMPPPQTQQTQPLAGKEQPKMDPNLILAALGLPEGATTDMISAFAASAKGAAEANAKILAALDVDSTDKAVIAIGVLKEQSTALASTKAELEALNAKIEADKVAAETAERENIIARLVADGKAIQSDAEMMGWLNAKSLDDLRMHAKFAKAVIPGSPEATVRENDPTALALTDREKAEARELNMTDAEYLASKREVQAKYGA